MVCGHEGHHSRMISALWFLLLMVGTRIHRESEIALIAAKRTKTELHINW
jgi:hypothetical protein